MTPDRPDNLRYSPLLYLGTRLLCLAETAIRLHFRRRHPDVFSATEAAVYLNVDNEEAIRTLRRQGKLEGVQMGREIQYHRQHLDAAVKHVFDIKECKGEKR